MTGAHTICDAFAATVAAHADEPALRTPDGVIDWTWREYAERVESTARALAGIGVRPKDRVALWLSNRPEFHITDAAALGLGAVPFSVYPTFTAEQAEHVIRDAGSEVLITEAAFLDNLSLSVTAATWATTFLCGSSTPLGGPPEARVRSTSGAARSTSSCGGSARWGRRWPVRPARLVPTGGRCA